MYGASVVKDIQDLRDLGNSQRRVADILQINRRTVKKYWDANPFELDQIRRKRESYLEPYAERIRDLFLQHGNADVVRQELEKEGVHVVTRTLQDYIKPFRDSLKQERLAKSKPLQRIETPPGEFLQIDFGVHRIPINGRSTKVHFFVATLAYSRRVFVRVTEAERQNDWLGSIEIAFHRFGGIPRYLVCDNPKAMVKDTALRHSRCCTFNERFAGFCHYWNVIPIACYPRYPQSKGKVERMVGYVQKNGIAGHRFKSIEELQHHLCDWMTNVSDRRVMRHLVAEEEPVPIRRFEVEKRYLRPVDKPHFLSIREETRKVDATSCITIDTRQYQLEAKYRGLTVRVLVQNNQLQVFLGKKLIGTFDKARDTVKRSIFTDVTEHGMPNFGATDISLFQNPLQRSLSDYESVAGGRWS